jgi:hypothetical protein
MFEETMNLLLAGEFICPIRYPQAFSYLSQEAQQKDVAAYLARIGRSLESTEQGSAWFMAFERLGNEEMRVIRDDFTRIKNDIRFLVRFFLNAMRGTEKEEFYAPGDTIEAHALMAVIDSNPGLRAEFQSLSSLGKGTSADGKLKSSLDKQLRYLRDDGYLVLANAEREIYQVTGKIDYLTEVVRFVMNADNIKDDLKEDDAPTPSLL